VVACWQYVVDLDKGNFKLDSRDVRYVLDLVIMFTKGILLIFVFVGDLQQEV